MIKMVLLPCLVSALMAQETPERPSARLSLGTFTDSYSDSTGTRKGWSLGGEWFHDEHGPWSFSAVGTQRPEGNGTLFTVAKDHSFGASSWAWASMSMGTGADFVPTFRGDVDLNLGLSGPWSLGLEAAWSRFRDESSIVLLQAGPTWLGEVWSASARVQQMRYLPGEFTDTGYLADLRWGTNNLHRWHSLRVGWGQGIIDSLQPSGSYATSTQYGGSGSGRGRGPGGTTTSTTTTTTNVIYPKLNEFLISTSSHMPLTRRFAIRADVAWAQRDTQFKMWSASLQTIFTF